MRAHLAALLLLALVAPSYAFGSTSQAIETDKRQYVQYEQVRISGNVGAIRGEQPVFLQVFNPAGAAYRFDIVYPGADGSFTYSMKIGGELGAAGTYAVKATYYGTEMKTSFSVTELVEDEHKYTILVEGLPYTITYSISGGTVKEMVTDRDTKTLVVFINADYKGELKLTLPGSFVSKVISSESLGAPLAPIVFVDDEETEAEDKIYDCYRTIEIPFKAGNMQIEIVGAFLAIATPYEGNSFITTINVNDQPFQLPISTNADACAFSLIKEQKKLYVDVTGPKNEQGMFKVAVPHYFRGGNYTVMVNNNPVEFETAPDPRNIDATIISFSYNGNTTRSIDIIGTSVMPEFGSIAVVIAAVSIAGILFVNRSRR